MSNGGDGGDMFGVRISNRPAREEDVGDQRQHCEIAMRDNITTRCYDKYGRRIYPKWKWRLTGVKTIFRTGDTPLG
jgi:hypothetical protein